MRGGAEADERERIEDEAEDGGFKPNVSLQF